MNLSLSRSLSFDWINWFMKAWKVCRLLTDSLMAAVLERMALNDKDREGFQAITTPVYLCISVFSDWTRLRFLSIVDLICSM